jgi:diguanylate cyclase (GGDEF)-like protein
LCVEDTSSIVFRGGALLDVFGYPVFAAETPALMDTTIRPSGNAGGDVAAQATTASRALADERSGELVSVEGKLVGVSADAEFWQLTLVSQNVVFSAMLPKPEGADVVAPWQEGSYVRVTGVCRNEVDARMGRDWTSKQRMASIRILLRTVSDVVVLRKPSWWTPAHTSVTLSAVVLAMLAVAGWVVLLRRQVDQKTQELRESERRFRHLAHHDPLTGLPNRAWFHERAQMALGMSRRNGNRVGLLLLDLDHFKPINDTLGHDAGDALLCALAERASAAVRKVDTVARLGGDEFAVVLPDVSTGEDAEAVARKILAAVCQPVTIKGRQVAMSVSIGVAVFPEDGDSEMELLRSADLAMYESKKLARGGVRRYQRKASVQETESLTLIVGSV